MITNYPPYVGHLWENLTSVYASVRGVCKRCLTGWVHMFELDEVRQKAKMTK